MNDAQDNISAILSSDLQSHLDARRRLAPLQFLGMSLIIGMIMFGVGAWLTAPLNAMQTGTLNVLRIVWGALAASELPALWIIRQSMLNRAESLFREAVGDFHGATADPPSDDAAFRVFRTWSIISLAIPESLAIFGCVILMLSGKAMDALLILAPVIFMLAVFPTANRWQSFAQAVRTNAERRP